MWQVRRVVVGIPRLQSERRGRVTGCWVCFLCKVLVIPDVVFVVVREPSDPLYLSLESKRAGCWRAYHDVAVGDRRWEGADQDGIVTRSVPTA